MISKVHTNVPNSINDAEYNCGQDLLASYKTVDMTGPGRKSKDWERRGKGFHGMRSSVNRGSEVRMCGCSNVARFFEIILVLGRTFRFSFWRNLQKA